MHKILIILFFSVLFQINFRVNAQSKNCNLKENSTLDVTIVNTNDISCISKNNDKILLYTFGIWCKPCILHLKNAHKLSVIYNVDLYVLLIDTNNSNYMIKGVNFLRENYLEIKILALDDEYYGKKRNKKYKTFLKEITPKRFKNMNGMSKYILMDSDSKVLMVTNWKDDKGNDWKDDYKMLENKIIPFLSKKG